MSTRPQFKPQIVIPSPQGSPVNGSAMATNITSAPTILSNLSMISYAFSWTGTSPVGTVSIQVSNDFSLNANGTVANAGIWNTITVDYEGNAVPTIPISGNSGNGFVDIDASAAYACRAIYMATSGVGVLTAVVNAKVM